MTVADACFDFNHTIGEAKSDEDRTKAVRELEDSFVHYKESGDDGDDIELLLAACRKISRKKDIAADDEDLAALCKLAQALRVHDDGIVAASDLWNERGEGPVPFPEGFKVHLERGDLTQDYANGWFDGTRAALGKPNRRLIRMQLKLERRRKRTDG
jgi:hypothetical protein